jgi:four helix bundle protein
MHNFKELKVWKAGIEITKAVFILTRTFPSEEKFGLISQMTRSAVSIPSNIPKGGEENLTKNYTNFLILHLDHLLNWKHKLLLPENLII